MQALPWNPLCVHQRGDMGGGENREASHGDSYLTLLVVGEGYVAH